uniref:Uncharacterized protein n=1 Tax=Ciona intestinalis TaxID=7719 RepID=F6T674_CIOIN
MSDFTIITYRYHICQINTSATFAPNWVLGVFFIRRKLFELKHPSQTFYGILFE